MKALGWPREWSLIDFQTCASGLHRRRLLHGGTGKREELTWSATTLLLINPGLVFEMGQACLGPDSSTPLGGLDQTSWAKGHIPKPVHSPGQCPTSDWIILTDS
ncbi:hypothetical protein CBL_09086 [Carabus blaptoides fortunei]